MPVKIKTSVTYWQAKVEGAVAQAKIKGMSPRIAAAYIAPTVTRYSDPEFVAYKKALNLVFPEDARLTEKYAQK